MIKIKKDEHIVSWIRMLANINGVDIMKFYTAVLGYPPQTRKLGKDYIMNLEHICRTYEADNFPGIRDILMYHTDYAACLPFRKKNKSLRISEVILRNADEKRMVPYYVRERIEHLMVCPQCRMDDRKRGEIPYVREWHNLPGVIACHKHGCRLVRKGSDGEIIAADENERRTAEFMYGLYRDPVQAYLEDTVELVKTQDVDKGYVINKVQTSIDEVVSICAELFTVQEFRSGLLKIRKQKDALDIILTCRCDRCGTWYHMTPEARDAGFGCPVCDRDIPYGELARRFVERHEDGNYRLVSLTDGTDAVIRHEPCGGERMMRLYNFLWKSVTCPVCTSLTVDKMQDRIDPEIKKFRVISYRMEGKLSVVEVEHVGHGHQFTVNPYRLSRFPFCRVCETYHTGDNFIKLIEEEPDYELAGPYDEKGTDILHRRCGTISRIVPGRWRGGQRCLLCGSSKDGKPFLRSDVYLAAKKLGNATREQIRSNTELLSRTNRTKIGAALDVLVKAGYLTCDGEVYRVSEQTAHLASFGAQANKGNIKDRKGETSVAHNGQMMTIVAYRGCKDIDIMFEDGTIKEHQEYRYFKAGEIGNPNYMYRKYGKKRE